MPQSKSLTHGAWIVCVAKPTAQLSANHRIAPLLFWALSPAHPLVNLLCWSSHRSQCFNTHPWARNISHLISCTQEDSQSKHHCCDSTISLHWTLRPNCGLDWGRWNVLTSYFSGAHCALHRGYLMCQSPVVGQPTGPKTNPLNKMREWMRFCEANVPHHLLLTTLFSCKHYAGICLGCIWLIEKRRRRRRLLAYFATLCEHSRQRHNGLSQKIQVSW